jgi:hypothetical protein
VPWLKSEGEVCTSRDRLISMDRSSNDAFLATLMACACVCQLDATGWLL